MEIIVGKDLAFAGQKIHARGTQDGSLAVKQTGGSFEEAVARGKCFAVCNQAGVTSQAGLSATTPVLTLYNAAGSGVNGVLWYANAIHIVAAAAAAVTWIGVNTNVSAAAVTGTATTAHRNLLLGGGAPTLQPLLAATLPAAPVGLAILGAALTGAITVATAITPLERWFNGSIIIAPGTAISLQTSTASGSSGLLGEFVWEERPILS